MLYFYNFSDNCMNVGHIFLISHTELDMIPK